jgi:hypothetical protein
MGEGGDQTVDLGSERGLKHCARRLMIPPNLVRRESEGQNKRWKFILKGQKICFFELRTLSGSQVGS